MHGTQQPSRSSASLDSKERRLHQPRWCRSDLGSAQVLTWLLVPENKHRLLSLQTWSRSVCRDQPTKQKLCHTDENCLKPKVTIKLPRGITCGLGTPETGGTRSGWCWVQKKRAHNQDLRFAFCALAFLRLLCTDKNLSGWRKLQSNSTKVRKLLQTKVNRIREG